MSSVERPLISGCSILEKLGEFDASKRLGVVYHGTPIQLSEISPKLCRLWDRGDYLLDTDRPVVCATDNPTIAAFRALVPRSEHMFGCGRTRNERGGLTFYVPEFQKKQFMSAIGYVSLCDRGSFEPYAPEPNPNVVTEFRTDQPVIPLCNVEIDYTDLECLMYADPRNKLVYTRPLLVS